MMSTTETIQEKRPDGFRDELSTIYIYIYIYIYVLHIYIYIYIYIVRSGARSGRRSQEMVIVIVMVTVIIIVIVILIIIGPARSLEGTKGLPRNGGRKQQLVWSCLTLDSLHVQTLMSTDVQTPFLGTPLGSSRAKPSA